MFRVWTILLGLSAGLALAAQEVTLTADAPRVVRVGEQFQLSYTVNARPSGFTPPEISDFYVLSGPNQSSSRSIQIINGKRTSSYRITYTYYLQATGAGKFTVPPAKVRVEGKEYSSNAVDVEVLAGEASTGGQTGSSEKTGQPAPETGEDLFVSLTTDKKNIYLGEPVIATIKLYTRLQLAGFGESKMPDFAGFWTQEIESPTQLNLVRENVGGRIYNSGMIRKVILFPQKTGEIRIGPFRLETYVRQQIQQPRSPFDDFFGPSYTNVLKVLESKPLSIRVKALPEGAPTGYSGAVGKLSAKAQINKTEARTNDALTYRISISGTGNIQLLETPHINFPPDFETYDPKVQTDVHHTDRGQSGTKTFEYLLIPRHAGNYRIAPVSYSYFDPAEKRYRTLATSGFNLKITKSDEDETVGVIAGRTKEDLRIIGQDILFIKDEDFKLHRIGHSFFGSTGFILVYPVAVGLFLGILLLRRKRIRRLQDAERLRNQRARREARKRLRQAEGYKKKNETEAFYEAILKALNGYLVDKLNIPTAELSRDRIRSGLEVQKIPEERISEYLDLADLCEMARYAPSSVEGKEEEVYSRSIGLIGKMEQQLRK